MKLTSTVPLIRQRESLQLHPFSFPHWGRLRLGFQGIFLVAFGALGQRFAAAPRCQDTWPGRWQRVFGKFLYLRSVLNDGLRVGQGAVFVFVFLCWGGVGVGSYVYFFLDISMYLLSCSVFSPPPPKTKALWQNGGEEANEIMTLLSKSSCWGWILGNLREFFVQSRWNGVSFLNLQAISGPTNWKKLAAKEHKPPATEQWTFVGIDSIKTIRFLVLCNGDTAR